MRWMPRRRRWRFFPLFSGCSGGVAKVSCSSIGTGVMARDGDSGTCAMVYLRVDAVICTKSGGSRLNDVSSSSLSRIDSKIQLSCIVSIRPLQARGASAGSVERLEMLGATASRSIHFSSMQPWFFVRRFRRRWRRYLSISAGATREEHSQNNDGCCW